MGMAYVVEHEEIGAEAGREVVLYTGLFTAEKVGHGVVVDVCAFFEV